MVKASQFTDPTKYNARTAEANAAAQDQQHAQALLKSSNAAVQKAQAEAKLPVSNINPATGNSIDLNNAGQKVFGGITSDPNALNRIKTQAQDTTGAQQLQTAQTVYGAKGAGTTAEYNPDGSLKGVTQILAPSTGTIQDKERARLKASGMTDSQIAEREAQMQPQIQRTMSNTGLKSTDRQNQTVTPLQQKLDAIDKKYANITASGNVVDAAAVQAEKQTAIAEDTAINTKAAEDKKAAQDKQAADTAASTTTETPVIPDAKTTGTSAAIEAGLAALGPQGAALAAAFHEQQLQNQLAQASLKTTVQTQQDNLDAANKTAMDSIDELKQGFKEGNEMIKSLIEDSAKANEESLQMQEKAAKDKAAWDTLQLQREASKQKVQAHEAMVAQIALSGGFGQDAGLAAVRESDAKFDSRIEDLRTELGVQNTDIAARFSALYLENKNNYINNSIANVKEGLSNLERLTMQGNTQTQAYTTASNAILQNIWNGETALRKEQADNNMGMIKEMNGIIHDDKVLKATERKEQYNQTWEQFKFQQDQLYKYTALESSQSDREENLSTKRDDKAKYNAQLTMDKIRQQMEGNMVFDQYKQARTSWDSLETAYKDDGNPFRDRAMAKSYEKLVEVGSVVMPGEYADITSNVPLASKILGKISQVAEGGQAWTDAERTAIKDLSENLFKAYEVRRQEEAQIFNAAIQFHNQNTENPQYHLSPSMFNLPSTNSSSQVKGFETLLPEGYKSPFSSPDGGGGTTMIPKENGKITTGFLNGVVTGYGSKYWEAGLDVAAPKNTPITTPIGGIVEKVVYNPNWKGTPNNPTVGKSQNGGFGNQVVVKYPDGVKMQFSHANSIPIGKDMIGNEVPAGSTIAYVGNTGNTYGATGVHADITGFKSDGSKMTAKEVAAWLINHSHNV